MQKRCSGQWIDNHKQIVEQRANPHFGMIDSFSGIVDEREFIAHTILREQEPICYDCKKTADKCGFNGLV